MSSKGAHPEIGSIIRKRDEIHSALYTAYRPLDALGMMVGLLYELEETDQLKAKDLLDELLSQEALLSRFKPTAQNRHGRQMKNKYRDYLRQINLTLWKGGYLFNQKYGMYFPSEDKPDE